MERYVYRIETRRIKEPEFPYVANLSSPLLVRHFTKSLDSCDQERFIAVFLSSQNSVIGIYIQEGTVDRAVIHPREILKRALLCGAASLVLIHNHPSGDIEPSAEDKQMTIKILEACRLIDLRLVDHLIIGGGEKFFSFQEKRLLE